MTRVIRWTAAGLVVACLGGCAAAESAAPSTLPPLTIPRVPGGRGVSLREAEPPAVASAAVGTNVDEVPSVDAVPVDPTGLGPYPTMHWMLGLSGVLDEVGDQPVTILAPSERAFRDFKFVDYYGLMSNPVAMAPILRRHVVLGVYTLKELAAAGTVTTLAGEQLTVWLNGRRLNVNEATITAPTQAIVDVAGGAVVAFEIDRVLLLPELSAIP